MSLVDLLIAAVVGVLTAVLGWLPTWSPPTQAVTDTAGAVGSGLAWANNYFPVVDVFAAVGLVIGFRVLVSAWHVLVWVYDRIPFKAT